MALLEDTFGSALGGWGGGLVVGVAALLAGPALLSGVGSLVRPIAKVLMKGGLAATDGVRSIIADASDQVADLVAEVKAERRS